MKTRCALVVQVGGTALTLLWLLGLICLSLRAAGVGAAPDKIGLVPFVIGSRPFQDAPPRTDEAAELHHLQEEATKQAARTITEHGLAKTVERVLRPDAAGAPLIITGTVSLPLSLPRRVSRTDTYERHEEFAVATATLLLPDGHIAASSHVTLGWRACWWTHGKSSVPIPFDTVLADFTRKATDKAIRSVFRDLATRGMNETRR